MMVPSMTLPVVVALCFIVFQSLLVPTHGAYAPLTHHVVHRSLPLMKPSQHGPPLSSFLHPFRSRPQSDNAVRSHVQHRQKQRDFYCTTILHSTSSNTPSTIDTNSIQTLNQALTTCDLIKNCRVQIAPSKHRLGLIATEKLRKNDVVISIPYDDQLVFTPALALQVYKDILPDGYDGWTGDTGLLAMVLLNEMARCTNNDLGVDEPKRKKPEQVLIESWIKSLPSLEEMKVLHPLLWSEDVQEVIQSSSTKKIYRVLDDVDEDANWLEERVWSQDRTTKFPKEVIINDKTVPCFTPEGFRYAYSLITSRSVFVDGTLRLLPILDFANHDDYNTEEITSGTMGTFGTTKGAQIRTLKDVNVGDEIYVSYGPKSAAEYLLEHGFIPEQAKTTTCVSEVTFEINSEDRFHDDKLDVLEYETYDLAPMEPIQSYDVVYEVGKDGEPDLAMIQFLRLVNLGGTDAFLLESLFRKEIWGFMSLPVSEKNEKDVVDMVVKTCDKALAEMDTLESSISSDTAIDSNTVAEQMELAKIVREVERKALTRTKEYMVREREALDLKEYYQERRLKDLGLDSEWTGEDDMMDNPDVGWGQTRAPGGADYDW